MIHRILYVLSDLIRIPVCLLWVWYCGLHWLVTGNDICCDDRFAVVRFLGRR